MLEEGEEVKEILPRYVEDQFFSAWVNGVDEMGGEFMEQVK